MCRCVFFFLFLLKKQQHLQRAEERGEEEVRYNDVEKRGAKQRRRGRTFLNQYAKCYNNQYIPVQIDFRRVRTVAGRRFSLINIQSFQEFFL